MKPLVSIVVALAGLASCQAEEPIVAFRIEDGWVRFAVTRDDRPVAGVTLKVVDRPGAPFVEGEADDHGVGSFPAPVSPDCVVTFSLAGKEADPILIQFPERKTRVEPERVLLTFDRRPCCTLSKLRPAPEATESFPWLFWTEIGVGVACLLGGVWLYRTGRR